MSQPLGKVLLPSVIDQTESALSQVGFRRRREGVFTCPINKDVIGWLGLTHTIYNRDGILEMGCVAGARNQHLERTLADIMGEKFHPYIPPTVAIHLGYLMPSKRYTTWLFRWGQDYRLNIEELVMSIKDWAEPFMLRCSSLENLYELMKNPGIDAHEKRKYRIPVALLLLKRFEEAKDYLENELQSLGARDDLAAERYRHFVRLFLARLPSW